MAKRNQELRSHETHVRKEQVNAPDQRSVFNTENPDDYNEGEDTYHQTSARSGINEGQEQGEGSMHRVTANNHAGKPEEKTTRKSRGGAETERSSDRKKVTQSEKNNRRNSTGSNNDDQHPSEQRRRNSNSGSGSSKTR